MALCLVQLQNWLSSCFKSKSCYLNFLISESFLTQKLQMKHCRWAGRCSLSKLIMMKTPTQGIFFPQPSESDHFSLQCFVLYIFHTLLQMHTLFTFFIYWCIMFEFFRYSCINEVKKLAITDNTKIFVYFVTKLPRTEGGTSFVGFQGG